MYLAPIVKGTRSRVVSEVRPQMTLEHPKVLILVLAGQPRSNGDGPARPGIPPPAT
jgi:hypothetical protein